MSEQKGKPTTSRHQVVLHPLRVHLPPFLSNEEVGLGDAITRVSYALGMRSCGGCERRAVLLNRWMVFTR
jgi:hypothetical protein